MKIQINLWSKLYLVLFFIWSQCYIGIEWNVKLHIYIKSVTYSNSFEKSITSDTADKILAPFSCKATGHFSCLGWFRDLKELLCNKHVPGNTLRPLIFHFLSLHNNRVIFYCFLKICYRMKKVLKKY